MGGTNVDAAAVVTHRPIVTMDSLRKGLQSSTGNPVLLQSVSALKNRLAYAALPAAGTAPTRPPARAVLNNGKSAETIEQLENPFRMIERLALPA
jgi:hypothetical protein